MWSLLWRITAYSESNRVQLSPLRVHFVVTLMEDHKLQRVQPSPTESNLCSLLCRNKIHKWPQVCLAGLRTPRNIPEDTLCPPLISKLPNCLPGCWGPREPPPSKKQGHRGHQRAHLEARGPSTTLVEARWTPPTTPLYYSAATKVCPFSRDLPAQLHNILETPLPLESSRYREGREGFGWSKS